VGRETHNEGSGARLLTVTPNVCNGSVAAGKGGKLTLALTRWWEGVVTLHSLQRTGFTVRLPELPALPSQRGSFA
jgi:hypothetical protein